MTGIALSGLVSWSIADPNPRTLNGIGSISSFLGSVRAFSNPRSLLFYLTVTSNSEAGIQRQQGYTTNLYERLRLVSPILLCLASNLIMCLGWLRLRFCTNARQFWLGLLALLIGFPASVLSWLIISGEVSLFHGILAIH